MIKRYTVLMSALLLAFSSCSDRDAVRLMDAVESYIHSDPVRALSELECVDRSRLRSRSATARFSLLYTMALDKTEQMPDNDSTIRPALDYYRRHGSIDDRIKSLYYLGCSQYEAKAYSKAIVTFTKAYALLEKSRDDRYCGLVNQAIADTYMASFNDSEVMPYLDAAYDCFVRYGDKSLADLTLYTKASQCSIIHQHEEADSLFRRVIEGGNIPDSDMPDILSNYAVALIAASSDDTQRIEELFSKALDLSGGTLKLSNSWAAYAYILAVNGKKDLSESIFRQLQGNVNDGSSVEFWESRAYAATHDYKSAYHSLKRSLYVQDSIISVKLQNSSAKAQRDYFSLQERASRSRLRSNRLLFALIIMLILMVAGVLYYFFLKWRAAVQKEKFDLMSMSEMVKHQLEEVQAHSSTERLLYDRELRERDAMLSRMKSGYVQSYRRQFRYLGILGETFLTSEGRRDSYKVICEKVRTVVGGMNLDVTRHSDFESMLNAGLDDVMKHVHSDFPSLSEDEYRFISYVIAGFDATTICVILNMPSQASVYMKKSRMKKLLLSSTSEYREQYAELFG